MAARAALTRRRRKLLSRSRDRRPGATHEERCSRPAWSHGTPDRKKPSCRPAVPGAALHKVRNQFVGDADFDFRLPGALPELPHRLPGLIAELAIDGTTETIETLQLDLRLPDLLGRVGSVNGTCRQRG
jgi:hypothetical protein